jgi:hypothetical protein
MNIGRLITGPNDKGYDPKRFPEMSEAEVWLAQLNDDAAHNDGRPGVAARAVLRSSASIVAARHAA